MLTSFVLQIFLDRCVSRGSLTLVLSDGTTLRAGRGPPGIVVHLADDAAARELLLNPEMALGELYTDGRLTIENGSVHDLLDLLGRNIPNLSVPLVGALRHSLRERLQWLARQNSKSAARQNVERHYDLDNRIYPLFLDRDLQYSCAYFERADQSLEDAQFAKKRHIAAKLNIEPGLSVLDIGSGWGGMALYLAEVCGAQVRGITLSTEQLQVSLRRAHASSAERHLDFRLEDYRTVSGVFDRIVSIGMFEHVGLRDYDTFFCVLNRTLKDRGVALLHFIGRLDGTSPINPWFGKYIFPGSYLPALSEVTPAIERQGLVVTDIEVLRLHYADTLAAWRHRFLENWTKAAELLGQRFCRMWEFYLSAAEIGFLYGGLAVFQFQLAKRVDALPRTRSYIAAGEARLRAFEPHGRTCAGAQ